MLQIKSILQLLASTIQPLQCLRKTCFFLEGGKRNLKKQGYRQWRLKIWNRAHLDHQSQSLNIQMRHDVRQRVRLVGPPDKELHSWTSKELLWGKKWEIVHTIIGRTSTEQSLNLMLLSKQCHTQIPPPQPISWHSLFVLSASACSTLATQQCRGLSLNVAALLGLWHRLTKDVDAGREGREG